MELDPSGTEIETPPCLLDGSSGQVETDEGDEPAAGAFGVRERAVVRDRERRLAIVLVHAEDERGLESVSVEYSRELLVAPARPVDVVTEVGMDVDEPRVLGSSTPRSASHSATSACALERRHRSSFGVLSARAAQTRGAPRLRHARSVAAATAFTIAGAAATTALADPLRAERPVRRGNLHDQRVDLRDSVCHGDRVVEERAREQVSASSWSSCS